MVCRFLLVRHGESTWNADGRLQGQSEAPLSELGRQQAAAIATRLRDSERVNAVYSSDLGRAVDTARAICSAMGTDLPPEHCLPAFRERHLGVLQGVTKEEAKVKHPEAWGEFIRGDGAKVHGGGESASEVRARATEALERVAKAHDGEVVVVVSHGGTLQQLRLRSQGKGGRLLNASLSSIILTPHDKGFKWESAGEWGSVSHLQEGAQTASSADFAPTPPEPK
eukprot:Hpha_TRINITY_DN31271_c0_g1::TRINITY_DN31271_c0_g1_i1::g.2402::m.2402/K15634/gpmB; probable phosphoglycerate mutase